jgi:hypothetical protein
VAGGGGVQLPLRCVEEGPPVGQAGQLVGPGLFADLVEGADLPERDRGADQRGDDAAHGEPGGRRGQPVAVADGEHHQAGQVARQRDGQDAPAQPGGRPRARPGRRPHGLGVAVVRGEGDQRHRDQPGEVQRPALDVHPGGGQVEEDDVAEEVGPDAGAEQQQGPVAPDAQDGAHPDEQREQHDVGHRVGQAGQDRGHAALGQLEGRGEQGRDGDGARAEGPDDPVQPHAGVEARHPGADEPDERDVERQVIGEVEDVGDGGERLLGHRGDRQRVHQVADDPQDQRDRHAPPGQPVVDGPAGGSGAHERRPDVDGVVEDEVVGDHPRPAVRSTPRPGGEQDQGRQRQAEGAAGRGGGVPGGSHTTDIGRCRAGLHSTPVRPPHRG